LLLHCILLQKEQRQDRNQSTQDMKEHLKRARGIFLQNLFAVESRCGNDRFHTVQKAAKFTRKDKRERSPESHKKKESYTARRVKGQQSSI
jgi:hypothetical protein